MDHKVRRVIKTDMEAEGSRQLTFQTEKKSSELFFSKAINMLDYDFELKERIFQVTDIDCKSERPSALSETDAFTLVQSLKNKLPSLMIKNITRKKKKTNKAKAKRTDMLEKFSMAIQMKESDFSLSYIQSQTLLTKRQLTNLFQRFKRTGCLLPQTKIYKLKWKEEHVKYLNFMMKIEGNWWCTAKELATRMNKRFFNGGDFFKKRALVDYMH